ncbi:MAG: hypothetical protein MUC43_02060 [Pirellula sp.]|nr:hypothetical protein [Pirellula sp.]
MIRMNGLSHRPFFGLSVLIFLTAFWGCILSDSLSAQPQANEPNADASKTAIVINVKLPLDAASESSLTRQLESVASRATGLDRPIVLLNFQRTSASQNQAESMLGQGTSFERSLSVSRWLTGPKGSRLRTIAYFNESMVGHAVLIALACEEIAMAADAEFGRAAVDEQSVDDTIKQAYVDVAKRRGSFPTAAVLSMLDPSETLFKLELENKQTEYRTIKQLESDGRPEGAWNEEQLVPNNKLFFVDGHSLRRWQWIAHTAMDLEQLGPVLRLNTPLVSLPTFDGPRVAMRTHLRGIVTPRLVNRVIRAIDEGLKNEDLNLIVIELDSPGGNLDESLRFAQYLADISPARAEVVAYLPQNLLGDASLVALACDVIYMHPAAKIGGPGEATINQAIVQDKKFAFDSLSKSTGRPIGLLLGCVSSEIPIFEYSSIDGRVILSNPDWLPEDPLAPQWAKGAQVNFDQGLDFSRASELNIASDSMITIDEVASKFGIDSLPKEKETSSGEMLVDWLASQTWLAFLLFTIGIGALFAELNTPGLGVGGAIAAVCFGLFFWMQFLNGTVEWLEVLLIVGGIVFVLIEIFVVPGFGIFGFLGVAMLGIGLLLTGQTFVLPSNAYQRQRVVEASGQLGIAVISLIGLAFVFRKQIANSPMVKWMSLEPPKDHHDQQVMQEAQQEALSFIGKWGTTLTRCNPAGRAMIDNKMVNVTAEDGWIDEGCDVEVCNSSGTVLVIRKRQDNA